MVVYPHGVGLQGEGSRTNYPPSITNAKVIDAANDTPNFAILKSNGSVETFGASYGADSSSVSSKLSSGVIEIVASGGGYAVRKYPNPVSPATLTITSNDSDNVITSGQVTLTATFLTEYDSLAYDFDIGCGYQCCYDTKHYSCSMDLLLASTL